MRSGRSRTLHASQVTHIVLWRDDLCVVRLDIKTPWVYFTIMIKTQIQLPDRLYREAKLVAEERELSLAEVLRRGVEYITRVYPPLSTTGHRAWEFPKAVRTGMRSGVTLASLRDLAANDEEPRLPPNRPPARTGKGG